MLSFSLFFPPLAHGNNAIKTNIGHVLQALRSWWHSDAPRDQLLAMQWCGDSLVGKTFTAELLASQAYFLNQGLFSFGFSM
jgi:hypothetical protein